jgi:chromosome segregation ATPase
MLRWQVCGMRDALMQALPCPIPRSPTCLACQAKAECARLDQEGGQLEDSVRGARDAEQALGGEVRTLQEALQRVQQSGDDKLKVYGPATSHVRQMIEQYAAEGKWRGQTPIGPFGMYVKIREPKFSQICESLFGRILNAFGVETHQDRQLLGQIFQRCNQ